LNSQHRAIRALLKSMAPRRATDYIKAFHLPEREEICIIEREVNDLSYTQICEKHGFSPEFVKDSRRRAFSKIADDLEYTQKARGD